LEYDPAIDPDHGSPNAAASLSASARPTTATYSSGSTSHHDDRSRLAHLDAAGDAAMTRVDELKLVYAEGRAADVGSPNPYRGQMVLAAVWLGDYRRMLDDMLANSPARQAFLRRAAGRQSHQHGGTRVSWCGGMGRRRRTALSAPPVRRPCSAGGLSL
jgi:hypothetical protein